MPTESVGRNYERNRENMTRRRRFKGITVETVNEGVAKTPAGLRHARIDAPTRSAKSLNNLNLIENEFGRDWEQGNNADAGGGALLPLSRIIKWCKHISMVRGSAPQPAPEKVSSADQKPSPPPYHQPDFVEKRQGFAGPLGLGEYVDSMGGGFDELDPPNGFPQTPIKSRSLIDISMSNLWGSEKEVDSGEDLEVDYGGSFEKVQWPSASPERRSNLLKTITRLVPLPPSPPNLVQFMDSPTNLGNMDMETTFFGNSEERWSTPAFVVTTFVQMQRGSLFSVHCVCDYIAELKLTINWAKGIKFLIDGELRKYKSAKGKRQRQLALQGSYAKPENEAELVELRTDFATFLNSSNAFIAHVKDTIRGGSVSTILIASHDRRLVTMKSLLPIQMPCALYEGRKTTAVYRKFLGEAPATACISSFYHDQKGLVKVYAFLYTDCILLASKCPASKASAPAASTANAKSSTRCSPILPLPMGVFKTLVRHSLNFLSVTITPSSPPCAGIESATGSGFIKTIPPPPPPPVVPGSSSSATSTGEEMEAGSENSSMTSGYEEIEQRLDFWWPLSNRYQLLFSEMRVYNAWRASLQATMDQIQSCFINQILRVKVLNAIAPEKCVHKYLALEPGITARELKEKAITAWNISCQSADAEIDVIFTDPIRDSLELPLSDEDRPFLLALYITTLTGAKTSDWTIDALATDQTDSRFTSRNLVFPLTPNRIPVTFVIRNSSIGINIFHHPRIFVDQELTEPLKSIVDRPKSTLIPEANRGHRDLHLHGFSQSTHNLSATSAASAAASSSGRGGGGGGGGGGGKGRSRSRLHLHFSRGNLVLSRDDKNVDDKDPPSQQFGIFGRLPREAWPDCRVSMSVMSLFVIIFYKGSLTQGIFRKSVQMSQLQAMIQRVDTNEDPLMEAECTPLCAANILKKYFSEIPGHLLMDEKWDNWIKITTLKTDEEIANYARKMTRELPDINQCLLTFLLFTLAQVRVNQEVNKMSVDALSTVWGPNLLERPKATPTVEDSALCTSVVACLIGPFTDAYCLRSLEFRQKLSVFFDEIWGQMVPPVEGSTKPLPEGISILELPSINLEEITSSSSHNSLRSSRKEAQSHDL